MKKKFILFHLLCVLALGGCDDEETPHLSVSEQSIEIAAAGGEATFDIETNAASWTINNPADTWVNLAPSSGTQKQATIKLTVTTRSLQPRSDKLVIHAGNATPQNLVVTQAASEFLWQLSANKSLADFTLLGGSFPLTITGTAPHWTLTSDAEWVQLSQKEGASGSTSVNIVVTPYTGPQSRTAQLTLSAEAAPTSVIEISQLASFPDYNTAPLPPDATGMGSTAAELASRIKVGWNIGNTLEAIGGETAWGNPKVTEELIKLVKQHGFNAIRIPCSWNQHLENHSTAKIKIAWLNRVKQVVQWCVDNDMYVILNIHWDGGWLENNCTTEKQFENNAKQKALWEQIATHLRDFDERLMFAGTNEPNVENASQMAVLQSYLQTFVDAVRATGGRNHYRTLVVQGPSTDVERTFELMSDLPVDVVSHRMMAEIHFYTPFQFCLMSEDANWGKMFYYWGRDYHSTTDVGRNATWGEEARLDELMAMMKQQFVDKGIPVVLGEYAVIRRNSLTGDNLELHLASRAYYLRYLTQKARSSGLLPFYWDAGNMGNNASALFNRRDYTVYDQVALDAIMEGVNNIQQ